ncbi:MAG: OmpA family protein [Hyphomicrobiaceae bacterium]|nr:OmpA family protein [Hyphomicrobiaceae bacterium]
MRRIISASLATAILLVAAGASGTAYAQRQPTAAEIIERLKDQNASSPAAAAPQRRTRGLSAGPGSVAAPPPGSAVAPAAADRPAVDKLFAVAPRGLSTGERVEAAKIARAKPTVDLVIYFDYNSAEISPKAVPTLVELGKALSSDVLAGRRFMVGGHTDARGGDQYNLKLSERRAEAIRRYLVSNFRIDEKRLLSIGFGKEQLKNAADPTSGENRRVQVVNLGD